MTSASRKIPWPLLAVSVAMSLPAQAEDARSFAELVSRGSAALDLRYRFEYVDEDGFRDEAEAHTVRTRLSLTSASFRGVSFMLEFDDLSHLGDDDFNSTNNGNTQFPVVADPEGTDLNQAWVK